MYDLVLFVLGVALAEVATTTPPAFGSKGQTGHTLGAAGVIESLLAVASIERRELPGNRGLSRSDLKGLVLCIDVVSVGYIDRRLRTRTPVTRDFTHDGTSRHTNSHVLRTA